jgi:hypothetical protein
MVGLWFLLKGQFFLIVWMNNFVFNKKRWHATQVERIIWENLLEYGGWMAWDRCLRLITLSERGNYLKGLIRIGARMIQFVLYNGHVC